MPSILIYDDNKNLRDSVCSLLSLAGAYEVSGAFADCLQVESQVTSYRPDVILMDINMPEINGIEAVRKIRAFDRHVSIIMLSFFDDSENVTMALYAGADGYLLKKDISDKLIEAIAQVLQGGVPMSPGVARMVIDHVRLQLKASEAYKLTACEKEILLSLSKGNTFKTIAYELFVTLDTVRGHVRNICDKLHVGSSKEAVNKALSERLV